jgi:hypothetical protein
MPRRSQASSSAGVGRVVRGADRVEARRLEQLDASLRCPIQADRAERAVGVVDTPAADLDRLLVELEADRPVPGKRADTESLVDRIDSSAARDHLRVRRIEAR